MLIALLIATTLDTASLANAGMKQIDEGDQRWYKATTYELCPEENRWDCNEWQYIETESIRSKIAPDQVDEWDNNGIDFAAAESTTGSLIGS